MRHLRTGRTTGSATPAASEAGDAERLSLGMDDEVATSGIHRMFDRYSDAVVLGAYGMGPRHSKGKCSSRCSPCFVCLHARKERRRYAAATTSKQKFINGNLQLQLHARNSIRSGLHSAPGAQF